MSSSSRFTGKLYSKKMNRDSKILRAKLHKLTASKTTTAKITRVLRNQEPYKYITNSLNGNAGQEWSNMLSISLIPFDPSESPHTRVSTKCQIKGLQLSMRIGVATGDTTNSIRVAIVRGRRSGALNMSDISYDYLVSGDDYHLPFNQKFVDVIWSKTFQTQEQSAGAVYPPYREFEKYFNLNKLTKFTERTTAGSDQPYNNTALYLICCSDSSLAPNPRITGQVRTSFKDLD